MSVFLSYRIHQVRLLSVLLFKERLLSILEQIYIGLCSVTTVYVLWFLQTAFKEEFFEARRRVVSLLSCVISGLKAGLYKDITGLFTYISNDAKPEIAATCRPACNT